MVAQSQVEGRRLRVICVRLNDESVLHQGGETHDHVVCRCSKIIRAGAGFVEHPSSSGASWLLSRLVLVLW